MLFVYSSLPSSSQTLLSSLFYSIIIFLPTLSHSISILLTQHLPSPKAASSSFLRKRFASPIRLQPPSIPTSPHTQPKRTHTMSRTMLHLVDPPQPSSKSPYTHTGIGGAGNIRRLPPPTSVPATTIPSANHNHPLTTTTSHISHSSSSKSSSSNNTFNNNNGRFSTGRGGAGNIPPPGSCRAIFSLEEEEDMQRRVRPAPIIYHTGRGGEGNTVRRRESIESDGSDHDHHHHHRSLWPGNMGSGVATAASSPHRRSRDSKRSLDLARAWLKRW